MSFYDAKFEEMGDVEFRPFKLIIPNRRIAVDLNHIISHYLLTYPGVTWATSIQRELQRRGIRCELP